MEASTLQKKKNAISKGKLKKNIKNVLCRPDQVFWPEITQEEGKKIQSALNRYKIKMQEFKKPHWNDLKDIPKGQRPKPPKLKKVHGLLLGIKECSDSVQNGQCSAIIIEATVNPRSIVQPLLEMCTAKDIPVLCLTDLRKATAINFGVPTSCLGIKHDCLLDLRNEVIDIAKSHPIPKVNDPVETINNQVVKMDTTEADTVTNISTYQFLYRTNKKSRVFDPTSQEKVVKPISKFIGQDFIEFSNKPEQKKSKAYMKMILKRISNNPDRVKKK